MLRRLGTGHADFSVRITEDGVIKTSPKGADESVTWVELVKVSVVVTSGVPFGEVGCWVLLGPSGRACVLPLAWRGTKELVAQLEQLPGFDADAPVEVVRSTGVTEYVWWRRSWSDI